MYLPFRPSAGSVGAIFGRKQTAEKQIMGMSKIIICRITTEPTAPITIIFATNNAHKVEEVQSAIGGSLEVVSLREAGIDIDIPEPHDTLEANATEKSTTIHQLTGDNCFSEDTGL